jgi:glyoxylase-like metal-dependent hydrolase (beta-lactamase superfamily II)
MIMLTKLPGWIVAFFACATLLAGTVQAQAPAPAAPPVREIIKVAGEVYRFRNNNHYSLVIITPAGVIFSDPINADASNWLKVELKKRTDQPVRFVIYSHDHADHISGGEVFKDTAQFISQVNAKPVIIGEKRPTPVPNITFTDALDIDLGGTLVQLRYVGRNHSNNSIVVVLPKERVLYAVDFIPVKSMAFRDFPDAYVPEWMESLSRVEAIDFDILVPGHGPMGTKDDLRNFHHFLDDLHAAVLDGVRHGKTVEQLKAELKFPRQETWTNYKESLGLNIEGMYRLVQANRRNNQGVGGGIN